MSFVAETANSNLFSLLLVTSSKALAPSSDALVPSSFFLVAMASNLY